MPRINGTLTRLGLKKMPKNLTKRKALNFLKRQKKLLAKATKMAKALPA